MTIIFGTGYFASQLISYENELDIKFFIDNDEKKVGKQFWGYMVKKPEDVIGSDYDYVVLSSRKYAREMKAQLSEMGINENKIVNAWDMDLLKEKEQPDLPELKSPLYDMKIRNIHDYQLLQFDSSLEEMETVFANMVLNSPRKRIHYPGRCQVCNKNVNMILDNQYSGSPFKVNFRERLVCPICGLANRQRQVARVVFDSVPTDSVLYLTEQVTPMYQCLKKHYKNLIGSEYLGADIDGGTINEKGIRHEDLTSLSFQNETIDCIVSCDVFEHVADIGQALHEIYRVLKAGGMLYATFPMNFNQEHIIKRAQMNGQKIEHLLEPVYHGNPMSDDGSLVFYDYGMDFISLIKEVGFSDAYFIPFYSIPYGNIGIRSLFIFVARKQGK